jgi:hypothetical protein
VGVFTFAPAAAERRRARFRIAGIDGMLPDSYGLRADDLAVLLTQWQLGTPVPPPSRAGWELWRLRALDAAKGPLGLVVLKIASLFSFCGGPLIFCDWLKPRLGQPLALGLAFAPVALLLYGLLALRDGARDSWDRVGIQGGRAGAWVLLLLNGIAAPRWLTTTRDPDATLHMLGTFAALVTAAVYLRAASRALRRPPLP